MSPAIHSLPFCDEQSSEMEASTFCSYRFHAKDFNQQFIQLLIGLTVITLD